MFKVSERYLLVFIESLIDGFRERERENYNWIYIDRYVPNSLYLIINTYSHICMFHK